jgi:hypothetical protein
MNSTVVSTSRQSGFGPGHNSGSCGGHVVKEKVKKVKYFAEYFALTPEEKQDMKYGRASFFHTYRQHQRQNGGNACTSRSGVPTMINATTTTERATL